MIDETPTTPTPAQRRAWRTPAIIALIAFLLGLGAMIVLLRLNPAWLDRVARPAPAVIAPGQSLAAVAPASRHAPAPAIDLNMLSTREAALAIRIADLELRAARLASDAEMASGYATRAEGLLVAFAARRALDRGLGLGYIEEQLRSRFGARQPRAVATVLQAARAPVTIEDLRGGLDAIATDLMTGTTRDGWLTSLRRELGNLVVIHEAGTPSPLPADRLARARRMLQAGQVEAALSEVARMPGAAQADRWTDAARRYIRARHAIDEIESAAIQGSVGPLPSAPTAPPAFVPPEPR